MPNTIQKNLFHNIIFLLSNILFPLVSFSYASRIIGPEGYGKIQFIIGFTHYFIIFAAFGIPILGVREIAKVRHQKDRFNTLFSELFFINIISSAIITTIYFGIILSFNWFKADLSFYIIAGLYLFFSFSTLDWFFNGIEQFKYLSIRSVIIKSISFIALILLVKTKQDLIYYFLITIFSILGNNIWNWVRLHKLVSLKVRNLNFKKHLPALLTLFGASLSISMYTIVDTVLLGFLADEKSVGYYTAAVRINKLMIPMIIALGTVLIPRITKCIENKETQQLKMMIDKSFSFICILGIPIAFGLFLFSQEILVSLSGSEFQNASMAMQITAPLVILIGLAHLFGFQLLIPFGLEKKYFIATLWGMSFSIILNIILIPLLKDLGTAIATLTGEFLVMSISFYFVNKNFVIRFPWKILFSSITTCLLFIPIALSLKYLLENSIIIVIVAVPICAFVFFFVQVSILKNNHILEFIQYLKNYILKKNGQISV